MSNLRRIRDLDPFTGFLTGVESIPIDPVSGETLKLTATDLAEKLAALAGISTSETVFNDLVASVATLTTDVNTVEAAIATLASAIAGLEGGGGDVPSTRTLTAGGLVTGGGTLATNLAFNVAIASTTEAAGGTVNDKALTPASIATILTTIASKAAGDHVHLVATTSVAGYMSSGDKAKLDAIASGANLYVLPQATNSVLGGVKVGSGLVIDGSTGVLSVSGGGTGSGGTAYNPATVAITGGTIAGVTMLAARNILHATIAYSSTVPERARDAGVSPEIPWYGEPGFVPGLHMYAAHLIQCRPSVANRDAQECAFAINMYVDTGFGVSYSDPINNGKSGFLLAMRVKSGAGNVWAHASDLVVAEGYTGNFACNTEIDYNNRSRDGAPGNFNSVALFFGGFGSFTSTACIWQADGGTATFGVHMWYYGLFFQGALLIKSSAIMDASNSPVTLTIQSGTSHAIAGIQDLSTSPVCLDVAGSKTSFDVRLNGGAPVGIELLGNRVGINAYSMATGIVAMQMSTTHKLRWLTPGSSDFWDVTVSSGKLSVAFNGTKRFSVDVSGNVRATGSFFANTTA